jgi:hypothetical protein
MSVMSIAGLGDNFVAGSVTLADDTFAQEEIDFSILRMNQQRTGKYVIPKIKRIEIDFAPPAAGLPLRVTAAGDKFELTLTPTSQSTACPNISDREVFFRHCEMVAIAPAAANPTEGYMYLTKGWNVKNGYLVSSKLFMQVHADTDAVTMHYRIYYDWVAVDGNQMFSQMYNQNIIQN